jgi:type IV fimbrial biogenesis protein FimU
MSRYTRGFTIGELLVTIAILGIFAVFSLIAFQNIYRSSGVRVAATEVSDALRSARNKSLEGQNDSVYGVYVSTSSVTRFVGSTYTYGHASNTVYTFEAGAHATGTLVENGMGIVFARLTGTPSVTGIIYLANADGTSTTTVTVNTTGLIE